MQKVEEEGEIVMVKEHRELDRTGTRKGHIVIKVRDRRSLRQHPSPRADCVAQTKLFECKLYATLLLMHPLSQWSTSGHVGASHHAPGGGALSGGPHLHRGLPVDLQDLPLQPHGRGQKAPGVVPRPQSQGQGAFSQR